MKVLRFVRHVRVGPNHESVVCPMLSSILVHKERDKLCCDNYKGISLLHEALTKNHCESIYAIL